MNKIQEQALADALNTQLKINELTFDELSRQAEMVDEIDDSLDAVDDQVSELETKVAELLELEGVQNKVNEKLTEMVISLSKEVRQLKKLAIRREATPVQTAKYGFGAYVVGIARSNIRHGDPVYGDLYKGLSTKEPKELRECKHLRGVKQPSRPKVGVAVLGTVARADMLAHPDTIYVSSRHGSQYRYHDGAFEYRLTANFPWHLRGHNELTEPEHYQSLTYYRLDTSKPLSKAA